MVVCALTSNLQRAHAPGNVLLKKGDGNIPKDSVVNIFQITTVNKSDLADKIGALPASKIKQVIEGVRLLTEPRSI